MVTPGSPVPVSPGMETESPTLGPCPRVHPVRPLTLVRGRAGQDARVSRDVRSWGLAEPHPEAKYWPKLSALAGITPHAWRGTCDCYVRSSYVCLCWCEVLVLVLVQCPQGAGRGRGV